MNSIVMSSASTVEPATREPRQRLDRESSKAFAVFVAFRDLGPERTLQKVADQLQKSEPLMARWSVKFNWHNRAADLDDFCNQEMQRELLSRKIRSHKRALDIADRLDEKVAEAIELLEIQRPVRLPKGVEPTLDENGKPLPPEQELAITPLELVNMFRASQEVQHRILSKDDNEEICEFHYHFKSYDHAFDSQQPAAVLAARRKAREVGGGNNNGSGSNGNNF